MISSVGKSIHERVLEYHPLFKTSADDLLKWIPYASVFLLKIFGAKTRSSLMRQLVILGATESMRYFIADSLKKMVHEHRPLPMMGNHSFPSGHTTASFAGAEFMHKELKGSLPVLSCVGYAGAVVVATIRLMENKHWLRDVVAGAAIGILTTKVVYALLAKKKKKIIERKTTVEIDPDKVHKTFRALNEIETEE